MRCILFGILIFFSSNIEGQNDALKRANDFFKEGKFKNALLELNNIPQSKTSGPLIFKKAICYYELNELDKALAGINSAENIDYTASEILYYKGRILHHKGNFKSAIDSYKAYLEKMSLDDPKRKEVRDHIRQAGSGMDILYIDPIATIENAGGEINSTQNDEKLIQSSGIEGRFYFNSNRVDKNQRVSDYLSQSYDLDVKSDVNVYYTEKNGTKWSRGQKLDDRNINSYKNDLLFGFTMRGEAVFVLRGKEDEPIKDYELVAQNADLEVKNRIKELSDMIGTFRDLYFFNDSTVIFSSEYLKGEGGFDLFVTAYANNSWLTPKNLGPNVNTYKDEVSPYLSNDGSVLYFSSNRSFSVGGMDVFRTRYLFEQEKWTDPQNIGIPINSPGNETDFRLSDDGLLATYTSDRKDGFGKKDIYFAYLNEREEHQLFTVKNLGFVDYPDFFIDKIARPQIVNEEIKKESKEDEISKPIVNSSVKPIAQKVTINLPILTPDPNGELLYKKNYEKLDNLATQIISNDVDKLEVMSFSHQEGIPEYNLFLSIKTAEKIKEALVERGVEEGKIHLKGYGDYLPLIKSDVRDRDIALLNNRIQFKLNLHEDNVEVNQERIPADKVYLNDEFEIFKTLIDDAIAYKIQIATVRQMYRGTALSLYNDVQVEKDANTGNYLYSVGLYDNYLEANSILRELSDLGVTSLKIVPFVDGLRVPEKELINYASDFPELKEYIRSMSFTEMEEEED